MYLVDGHTHLEYGDLSKDYVLEFVKVAKEKGINRIHILDHTHRFKEFEDCYKELKEYDVQKDWLENKKMKFKDSLSDYMTLIEEVKKMDLGVELKFGLEVCYTPKSERKLKEILSKYHFDFLIGSIHSIDGILYDMSFSKELLWDKYSANHIYERYYELIKDLIKSNLFDQLGHPDQIKLFNIYPDYDLKDTYLEISKLLKEYKMSAESNTGAKYRYNHLDLGTNDEFLKILINEGVEIITASDAHKPSDVGSYIRQAQERVDELKGETDGRL